jgi:uncharacterized membrane protein
MPRIQTTRTVKFALMLLRAYLILMLVLILVYFVRNRSGLLGTRHPTPGATTAPAIMSPSASMAAGTATAPAGASDAVSKP